jgi:hypothetical protein
MSEPIPEGTHGTGPNPREEEIFLAQKWVADTFDAIEDIVCRVRRSGGPASIPSMSALVNLVEVLRTRSRDFSQLGQELAETLGIFTQEGAN